MSLAPADAVYYGKRPQTAPTMKFELSVYQNLTQVASVEGALLAGWTNVTVADPIRSGKAEAEDA